MTTTPRKLASNRANAQRSTGPRSADGKARASKNALRHGLNASLALDPQTNSEIIELTRLLGGAGVAGAGAMSGEMTAALRAAAEAQAHLMRIRRMKAQILKSAEDQLAAASAANWPPRAPSHPSAMHLGLDELCKLDGYERKAFSRRKTALRALWE